MPEGQEEDEEEVPQQQQKMCEKCESECGGREEWKEKCKGKGIANQLT